MPCTLENQMRASRRLMCQYSWNESTTAVMQVGGQFRQFVKLQKPKELQVWVEKENDHQRGYVFVKKRRAKAVAQSAKSPSKYIAVRYD